MEYGPDTDFSESVNYFSALICNFANCDMVGHTGIFDPIIKAVETVDKCTQDVTEFVLSRGGICLLTADHGNA